MEKNRWLDFLSSRVRSQISIENAEKAQNWGLLFLGFLGLGFALSAVSLLQRESFIYSTKILFLSFFHIVMILGFYIPGLLQKGEKPLSKVLRLRDFSSLTLMALTVIFYSFVIFTLSWQTATAAASMKASAFFTFVTWTNFFFSLTYLGLSVFSFLSLLAFPQAIVKMSETGSKIQYVGLGLHAALLFLFAFGYGERTPIGSPEFFEQFRIAGLFWVFILSSVLFVSRLFSTSSVSSLTQLELEVASGRLTRSEDILSRLKEVFVSKRFDFWIKRISHNVASKAHEIANFTHEAVTIVSRDKPTEVDLRQVEDRYRRGEALYKKLEKQSHRFLVSLSLFDLSEVEREKAEELKDQFSRELRNAKLELAQVRKSIDEKLMTFKAMPAALPETKTVAHLTSEAAPAEEASKEEQTEASSK